MKCTEKFLSKKLTEIVGSNHVITDCDALQRYGKDQSFATPCVPLCAVMPESREEVQKVLFLCNEVEVSAVAYSSGTSLQGAHIPAKKGITIDLSCMNKIHTIDIVSRNAIIEPGVTFEQIQHEAMKHGLRVLTPVGVSAEASVVATYAERTPLFSWPKYGPWEILTVEMVLPTGEIMGTGQMDIEACKNFPYSWATPYASVNRMYFGSQGTLGIITRAAITLKTLYESARVFFVSFEDIPEMLKAIKYFLHREVTEEVFAMNAQYLSLLICDTWPDEYYDLKQCLSSWTLVMVVRGYHDEVRLKEMDIEDLSSSLKLKVDRELPKIPDAGQRILQEIAFPKGFRQQNRFKGGWNPIFCHVPSIRVMKLYDLVDSVAKKHHYPQNEIGYFLLPLNHGGNFYFEPSFYNDPGNKDENARVRELFKEASKALIYGGGFFDRPYQLWAEDVFKKAPVYHDKIKRVKAMLDPKNILNPGKLALP